MSLDLISVFQSRMDRAGAEQIWSLAILGSFTLFVFKSRKTLRQLYPERTLVRGIRLFTLLLCLFIWSRQGIYLFYSHLHDIQIQEASAHLVHLTWLEHLARFCVTWSGVTLYTVLTLALGWACVRAIRKSGTS
mgnify:CR=1 FL=1